MKNQKPDPLELLGLRVGSKLPYKPMLVTTPRWPSVSDTGLIDGCILASHNVGVTAHEAEEVLRIIADV